MTKFFVDSVIIRLNDNQWATESYLGLRLLKVAHSKKNINKLIETDSVKLAKYRRMFPVSVVE